MHADYAVNNVLFANRPPARLVAIIDWETSTIGDPLLDVASFTRSLRSRRGRDAGPATSTTRASPRERTPWPTTPNARAVRSTRSATTTCSACSDRHA